MCGTQRNPGGLPVTCGTQRSLSNGLVRFAGMHDARNALSADRALWVRLLRTGAQVLGAAAAEAQVSARQQHGVSKLALADDALAAVSLGPWLRPVNLAHLPHRGIVTNNALLRDHLRDQEHRRSSH